MNGERRGNVMDGETRRSAGCQRRRLRTERTAEEEDALGAFAFLTFTGLALEAEVDRV